MNTVNVYTIDIFDKSYKIEKNIFYQAKISDWNHKSQFAYYGAHFELFEYSWVLSLW